MEQGFLSILLLTCGEYSPDDSSHTSHQQILETRDKEMDPLGLAKNLNLKMLNSHVFS